ncbi:MAG: hypothetical protein HZA61_14360 [Candidatus Eisenbacteria bacterium]|uniref:Uncharacterized protein n=1 Tax=Eiseniibacteriota bacterium TaxID=2212470 RepID=A0A933W454_UNCEI|nr:hypothetical protein [Candidatus Eisenbacteria bacterium]
MSARRLCLALAVTGALLISAAVVHANGLNLSWDACGAAGVANKQFACNINYWSEYLVLSAEFPMEWIGSLPISFDATLDLTSAQATLPNWWRLGSGECRAGAIASGFESDGRVGSCTASADAAGSITTLAWTSSGISPERRRLTISSRPDVGYDGIYASGEMLMDVLQISHVKTTGIGACSGCTTPVCIVLNSVTVYDYPPLGGGIRAYVTNPLQRNFVTWQGGTSGMAICPAATPARTPTWGALKAMYR